LIEADMHEHYGIDIAEPGLLESRSGRWLRVRIKGLSHVASGGLVPVRSRLGRALFPDKEEG
jgi:hypothetical protein